MVQSEEEALQAFRQSTGEKEPGPGKRACSGKERLQIATLTTSYVKTP
jgi:hypothetical protein